MLVDPDVTSSTASGLTRRTASTSTRSKAATVLIAALAAVSVVAWIATYLSSTGMGSAGMVMMAVGQGPWGVAYFLGVWAVMMVAMMFPAAAGMVRTFFALSRHDAGSNRSAAAHSSLFVGSYVGVWTAFGLAIAALYAGATLSWSELTSSGHVTAQVAGGFLLVAGVYQFTPLKTICLRGCQSPVSFLMARWRSGARGTLSMGLRHAAYCVGCCWALFLVLFAVGVMSLAWMAALATVVFAEKSFGWGERLARTVGVAFLLAGIVFVLWPTQLAWTLG